MTKLERRDCWPNSLTCKNCNVIIGLCFKREMKRRYIYKMQKLCKNSGFGQVDKRRPVNLDSELFENIVNQVKEIVLLIISIILSLRSNSNIYLTIHLISMKLLAILRIIYRSAYRNNSNYISLLMAMYLYSAGVKVNAIMLLNHLGLSVLYNLLFKKLRDIKAHSVAFIK